MCNALQQADHESFEKRHWKFTTNNCHDIQVQGNSYDWLVCVCTQDVWLAKDQW